MIREGSNADLAEQIARVPAGDLRSLAADNGYDRQSHRESLREIDIRRSSSIASSPRTIMLTTPESTKTATIRALCPRPSIRL
jgi:hypothetical protein